MCGKSCLFVTAALIAVIAFWRAPPPIKLIPHLKKHVKENMFNGPLIDHPDIAKLPCLGVYAFVGKFFLFFLRCVIKFFTLKSD